MKILAIGYNTAGTGLTRVMNAVMRRLADRHEIDFLGIGYKGDVVRDRGLTIYPTNPRGGDIFAAFQGQQMIEETRPSVLFIMHDIWLFDFYTKHLGQYRDRLKFAAYIPLDGKIVNEMDAAPLVNTDYVLGYTQFGRAQFEDAFRRLRESGKATECPPVGAIPHGIDPHRFYPFPELTQADFASAGRARAKQRVFGDRVDAHDSFIVLNASRLDVRKRVDLTVQGFAKFAEGKPANVKLCLHHAVAGLDSEKEELIALIEQCSITDRVLFNPFGSRVVDDEELNCLYNACDVGINTSLGEGWGLVNCEHGAAGAAQVVPDHTACAELWRGRGELIPPVRFLVPPSSVLEMGEVSPDGVARALDALYATPARCRTLARAAANAALDPALSWDVITRQFHELFVSLAPHA